MLTEVEWLAILLTAKLALTTVLILLIFGTPLAWWLSRTRSKWRPILEATVALPLILPPTVLGFYLLIALGPEGPIGELMAMFGGAPLAFTFTGLVIGSVIYSLPFVVQPLQSAFAAIGTRPLEVAATLGASPLDRFFSIALPLARNGYLTAAVLGFAHTVGEFGVVLMIGGSIPGETQVLSIAIYDNVEMLNFDRAHWLAGGLLVLSFCLLMVVYVTNRRFVVGRG